MASDSESEDDFLSADEGSDGDLISSSSVSLKREEPLLQQHNPNLLEVKQKPSITEDNVIATANSEDIKKESHNAREITEQRRSDVEILHVIKSELLSSIDKGNNDQSKDTDNTSAHQEKISLIADSVSEMKLNDGDDKLYDLKESLDLNSDTVMQSDCNGTRQTREENVDDEAFPCEMRKAFPVEKVMESNEEKSDTTNQATNVIDAVVDSSPVDNKVVADSASNIELDSPSSSSAINSESGCSNNAVDELTECSSNSRTTKTADGSPSHLHQSNPTEDIETTEPSLRKPRKTSKIGLKKPREKLGARKLGAKTSKPLESISCDDQKTGGEPQNYIGRQDTLTSTGSWEKIDSADIGMDNVTQVI